MSRICWRWDNGGAKGADGGGTVDRTVKGGAIPSLLCARSENDALTRHAIAKEQLHGVVLTRVRLNYDAT